MVVLGRIVIEGASCVVSRIELEMLGSGSVAAVVVNALNDAVNGVAEGVSARRLDVVVSSTASIVSLGVKVGASTDVEFSERVSVLIGRVL